jgi:hypothetical protein
MRIRKVLAGFAALALALTVVASALAAHPKAGKKYAGLTSAPRFNGFGAPVTFKVSSSGKTLVGFTYSTLGCGGVGGVPPGVDLYTKKFAIQKLGTIAVTSKGAFSAKNVKTTFKVSGQTTVTTSTVAGKFKSATTAVGSIKLSQNNSVAGKCGPVTVKFSAKVK